MLFDDKTILAAHCADYRARDLHACLRHFSDDIVFAVYLDPDLVSYAGVTIGKRALLRRLEDIGQQADVLDFSLASAQQTETDLHGSINFHIRHRTTGEEMMGSMRIVAVLRDGQFCRYEVHHDRARFEAFYRLLRFRLSDDGTSDPSDSPG